MACEGQYSPRLLGDASGSAAAVAAHAALIAASALSGVRISDAAFAAVTTATSSAFNSRV
eukprot:GDKH01019456.1.p5 GENE.GDKH01019456.1~~GDKH01019456.1.p5  ORF type:complete len:60 (+),score=3.44 GDKH01019456.1:333-512(+)